jgi:hypothetical protein
VDFIALECLHATRQTLVEREVLVRAFSPGSTLELGLKAFHRRGPKWVFVGPKQACGLSLQVVSRTLTSGLKDMRPKGECEHEDQKGGSLI